MHPAALPTLARRLCLVGAIACLAVSAALAAEPKPDSSIKTKSFEARVYLDATIKADPALAPNCLAEGRKWVEKNRAEAERNASRTRNCSATAAGPLSEIRDRSVVDGRYVSIVRADYEYTGGAHPNRSSDTILWDRSAGKRISIRPFFTETADNGPT